MVSPQMNKLTREKLLMGLERASKGLKKRLGESFEAAMIPAVADELLRLQDHQGVELKTASIPALMKEYAVDKDQDSMLGISLRVLEIL